MSDFGQSQYQPSSCTNSEDDALAKYEDDFERMIQENLTNGQDASAQKLFIAFQNAATNVTKMFRERSNGTNNWNSFHAAAESVTILYKESLDALKDAIQLGILNGEQRKTKDVLRWARRKQRRHIRSEEIYDYLVDRSPNHLPETTGVGSTNNGTLSQNPVVDDLQTFRQALVINDNESSHRIDTSPSGHSQQLESFVRQQVANQLARKRDFHSTDFSINDFQKLKRARHTQRSMAAISLILLFIVVTTFLVIQLRKWFLNYTKMLKIYGSIPCPRNRLPILGNILSLPLDPYEFSVKLGKFYHESKDTALYCLWLGTYPLLAFFHPVGLENFFVGSKHIKKSSDYNFLFPWLRTGLLTRAVLSKMRLHDTDLTLRELNKLFEFAFRSDKFSIFGAKWKNRRRIITPAFHDRELLNNFVDIYNEQSTILIQRLSLIKSGKETNLYPYIASCALDIICEAAMGLNIGAQSQQNSRYVEAVLKLTDIILKRQRMPWLWPDLFFKLLPDGREHDRYLKIVHEFTGKVIQDRAKDFQTNELIGKRSAFLDLLLKQMHDEQLTLLDIQEEVDTFMFEGHDTTAAAMNFTCFMIASHPEVQQKLHEEIDRVFGDDDERPCTMEDIEALQYLECVIKETLRLNPSVPFIAREVQEDFTYNGHQILKGSTAVIFIYYVHRDPKHFPDPDRFDPDRFLPENSQDRSPFAFVPFSAGSRNCIGQRFAMLEEKVILSWILRRFKLKTTQKQEDLRLTFAIILRSERGAFVQLEPRR